MANQKISDLTDGVELQATDQMVVARGGTNRKISGEECWDSVFANQTTTNLAEGTNLYFTNARVRSAISGTSPITVNAGTGAIGITQTSITQLGTITQGLWNASAIDTGYGGTGVANPTVHAIPIAQGDQHWEFTTLTNGQILIGSTGADPVAATLIEGANITITNGAGTITIASDGGEVYTAGNGIDITGNVISARLTATNLYFVGGVINTIQDIATTSSPTFVGATLSGTTASRLLSTNGSKALASCNITDFITSGDNILIEANGSGGATITGLPNYEPMPVVEIIGGEQALATDTCYIANYNGGPGGLLFFTLPAVALEGTIIRIVGKGPSHWLIAQNANQQIHMGSQSTTVGIVGQLSANDQYSTVTLLCTESNLTFTVIASVGTFTIG